MFVQVDGRSVSYLEVSQVGCSICRARCRWLVWTNRWETEISRCQHSLWPQGARSAPDPWDRTWRQPAAPANPSSTCIGNSSYMVLNVWSIDCFKWMMKDFDRYVVLQIWSPEHPNTPPGFLCHLTRSVLSRQFNVWTWWIIWPTYTSTATVLLTSRI